MAMTVWRCAYVKMTSRVTMSLGNVTVHQGSPAAAVRRVSMILSPDKCNRYQDGVTVVRAVWSCYLTVVRTLSIILSPDSYMDIKYDLVTWQLEQQKVWSCHLTVIRTKSMILSPDSVTVVRTVSMILSCDSCHDSVILSSDSYMDSKYDLVLWVVRTVCIILKCDSCQDSRYNFVTWQIDSCLDSKYDLVKLSGQSVWSCHVAVVRDWFCHMIL